MQLYDAVPATWDFLTGSPKRVSRVIAGYGMWVRPAANGRTVFIQRLSSTGVYRTVATTVLRATTSSTRSSYFTRLRILRSGIYRVRIRAHFPYGASNSRSRRITVV